MATVIVGGKIFTSASIPSLDLKYGPHVSLQAAWDYLQDAEVACIGLKVGIQPTATSPIVEYWFKDAANSINDLVPYSDFDNLENRPKYNGTVMDKNTNIPEVKTTAWDAKLNDAPSDNKQYARKNGTWAEVESTGGTSDFEQLTNRPKYNGTVMDKNTNIPEVKTTVWDGAVTALGGHTIGANVPADAKFTDTKPKYNGTVVTDATDIPEVKTTIWDAKQDALTAGPNITIDSDNKISSGITYITLTGTSGTLTDEQKQLLMDGYNVQFIRNGYNYKFETSFGSTPTAVYSSLYENSYKYILISVFNKTWNYVEKEFQISISDLDDIRSNATAGKSASDALGGHTVGANVPSDAVFTDTKPKYNGVVVTDATDIPEVKTTIWDGKSVVSVSENGTATDKVNYITVNGVEKKIGVEGYGLSSISFDATTNVITINGSQFQLTPYVPPVQTPDVYICGGFNGATAAQFAAKTVDELLAPTFKVEKNATDASAYVCTATWGDDSESPLNSIYYILVKDGFDPTYAEMKAGGITSTFTQAEIHDSSYWRATHADVTISETTYHVFGYRTKFSTTTTMQVTIAQI